MEKPTWEKRKLLVGYAHVAVCNPYTIYLRKDTGAPKGTYRISIYSQNPVNNETDQIKFQIHYRKDLRHAKRTTGELLALHIAKSQQEKEPPQETMEEKIEGLWNYLVERSEGGISEALTDIHYYVFVSIPPSQMAKDLYTTESCLNAWLKKMCHEKGLSLIYDKNGIAFMNVDFEPIPMVQFFVNR